jgi:hypothetical protein
VLSLASQQTKPLHLCSARPMQHIPSVALHPRMAEPLSPSRPEVLCKSSSNDAADRNKSPPSSLKKAASSSARKKKKQGGDEDDAAGNVDGTTKTKSQRPAYRNYMSTTQSRSRGAASKSTAAGRGSGAGRGGGKGGRGRGLAATKRPGLGGGGNKTKSHRSRQPISYSKATQLNSSVAVETDDKTRDLSKGHEDFGEGATVK